MGLFGLLRTLSQAAWAVVLGFLLLWQLGEPLRLDRWALDASPFTHLPRLPGGQATAAPLVWRVAVSAALIGAGLVGLRRATSSQAGLVSG